MIYGVTVTGTPELTLRAATIQMTRRNGKPSYMALSIPSVEHFEEVNSRIGEEMIVLRGGTEFARANLREISTEETPTGQTMKLVGYKQTTYGAGQAREIALEGYTIDAAGKRTLKSTIPDTLINPGDQVDLDGEPVTVGTISYQIGRGVEQMQITEA